MTVVPRKCLPILAPLLVAAALACAPREDARDSADSTASTANPPEAPVTTDSVAPRTDTATTKTAMPKTQPVTTRPLADSGQIIGRDSARKIDPRDPKRRVPVVPPTN